MKTPDAEAAYASLLDALRRGIGRREVSLVGVHSGGAWIAERLHADLCLARPCGFLSTAFHRDDYGRRGHRGLPAGMKATEMPFEVDGADIIVVDDILFTGRTVRAALNELFDYGRPARVELAVLLDRGGRELPVAADYCGGRFPLAPPRNYVLSRGLPDGTAGVAGPTGATVAGEAGATTSSASAGQRFELRIEAGEG